MKRLRLVLAAFLLSMSFGALVPVHANQVDNIVAKPICEQASSLNGCGSSEKKLDQNGGFFTVLSNAIFYIGGLISVVFLIIGGIQYIMSTGDSSRIAKGKNTIIYSVTGLAILLISRGVAGFVISRLQ
jgi:hypothetical protein